MKTKTGMSIGLAMTLMVGVFATMLALGLFTAAPVGADHEGEPVRGTDAGTVDGHSIIYKHTPAGPGAPANVSVEFLAPTNLEVGTDSILIEFNDNVQVPDTFDRNDITISASATSGGGGRSIAAPDDVTVQLVGTPANDPLVTLAVPDMDPTPDNSTPRTITSGATVVVTFRQSAGIKNPTEGSTYKVKVAAGAFGPDDPRTESLHLKAVAQDDTADPVVQEREAYLNSLVVERVLALSSINGTRGSTVTVTGKGFKNSTDAVVWLDKPSNDDGDATYDHDDDVSTDEILTPLMPNNEHDSGEVELCSAPIGGDDTFTCSFIVNASNFKAYTKETISAVDGRAKAADVTAKWELRGKITAVPESAALGDTVTIEFRDFPDGQVLTKLELGGVPLITLPSSFPPGSSSSMTLDIPPTVELGRQSLDAETSSSKTRRFTMMILGAQLEVTPQSVVPNQSVTVTGRGFTGKSKLGDDDSSSAGSQFCSVEYQYHGTSSTAVTTLM